MATATATMTAAPNGDVKAQLNFWPRSQTPIEPLDFTKPDAERKFNELNRTIDAIDLTVQNVRGQESAFTLDKNGFQYVDHEVPGLNDAKTDDQIRELLIPATEVLVKKMTGAYKTLVFTHRIRNLAQDEDKRADNRAPAHSVHTDFTPSGALQQLVTVLRDPVELERVKNGRVLAINVWRPLKTIKKDPLAVSDWQSITSSDVVANRMVFPNWWNELGKVNWRDGQRWFYLKEQTPSEPLVFKQFDSKVQDGGMTLPHSAFIDPQWEDAEARESIEIKMFAFIEE
ncbi:hypothetical protein K469DRAFT_600995 [Zopfia rhizophila CBS 207.26]|uniref:Methyltransferase n=1 Tax=Zopfia rhizophila CBS 207.26 TaxID=1314779 RepID=A0A6A6DGH9_9PEZI|nr:hypothetical protein K469DRAFT_600995 [Zopfia rhizophila CBS 207.26]